MKTKNRKLKPIIAEITKIGKWCEATAKKLEKMPLPDDIGERVVLNKCCYLLGVIRGVISNVGVGEVNLAELERVREEIYDIMLN